MRACLAVAFLFGCAVVQAAPLQGKGRAVEELIHRMELDPRPGDYEKLGKLQKSDAPALLKVLPLLRREETFRRVADRLRQMDVREEIPILVTSLDRMELTSSQLEHHPARDILRDWGWLAYNELLRQSKTGSYRKRLVIAKILSEGAMFRPIDKRLETYFIDLANADPVEFRLIAGQGLFNLWTRILGHMEMVHPGTRDSRPAFSALARLCLDSEPTVASAAAGALGNWLWSQFQSMPHYKFTTNPRPSYINDLRLALLKLKDSNDADVRLAALAMLRTNGDPGDSQVTALADRSAMVRSFAIASLSYRVTPQNLPNIEKVAESSVSFARVAAAKVLSTYVNKEAVRVLRRLSADPIKDVQGAARAGLNSLLTRFKKR